MYWIREERGMDDYVFSAGCALVPFALTLRNVTDNLGIHITQARTHTYAQTNTHRHACRHTHAHIHIHTDRRYVEEDVVQHRG